MRSVCFPKEEAFSPLKSNLYDLYLGGQVQSPLKELQELLFGNITRIPSE